MRKSVRKGVREGMRRGVRCVGLCADQRFIGIFEDCGFLRHINLRRIVYAGALEKELISSGRSQWILCIP